MAILVLVVLFWVGLPVLGMMLQGVVAVCEVLWIVIYSLWRFCCICWSAWSSDRQKTPTPTNQPVPRKPADPTTRVKMNNVKRNWENQGHTVGLINLTTGELFEPAPSSKNEGDNGTNG